MSQNSAVCVNLHKAHSRSTWFVILLLSIANFAFGMPLAVKANSYVDESTKNEMIEREGIFNAFIDNNPSHFEPWGYINKAGAFAIKPIYDQVGYFRNGKARALKGSSLVYLDHRGHETLAPHEAADDQIIRPGHPDKDRQLGSGLVATEGQNGKWVMMDSSPNSQNQRVR